MQDYIPREKDINQTIEPITVKQFDNNSRFLHVKLRDDDLNDVEDNSFDLADCTTALYIEPEGNTDSINVNFVNGDIESAESGIVTFLLPGGVTQNAGRYICEIWIYQGDETTRPVISTKPFTLVVEKSIRNTSAVEASASFSALDAALSDVTSLRAEMDALTAMADAGEIPAADLETEVLNIRVGADGTTYTSAGNAVRQTERILRNGVGLYDFDRVVTKSVSTYNRAFIAYPIMNPNAEFNFIVSEKSTTDALIVRFASSATPYSASNVQGITTLPADSTGGTGSKTIDVDKRTDAKYIVFTSTDANAAEMSFKVRLWTTDSVSGKILACVGMDGAAW